MAQDRIPFIVSSKNTINFNIEGDSDRIKKFSYRNKMLNDNFYSQVELELGNVYTKSKELGLISQIDDTNNLYRMIVEEISKVYDSGVTRTFDDDDTIQEDMTMLYDELEITEVLIQSNRYMNAFNDCLLQVGVDDNQDFTLKLRRPDNTIVVTDNDLNLIEVYIYIKEVDGKQVWYGYTDTEMFQVIVARADEVTESVERTLQEGMDDTVNKLGFLPFLSIHNGFRDDEFWQMYKGDDLVKGTVQIAIKLTFLNHLIKMQSFKQLVATGSNLTQLHGAVLDPQTILMVEGQDTNITTLDLESNYKSLWETIQSINNNIATNYKISPSMFRLTGTPTSGFGLKMENLKIDKFITKQQKYYSKVEKDLFNLLKRIDETLNLGKIKSDKVAVLFPPTTYPTSQQESLDIKEKEIGLGLNNQVSIIMERDGVDEEEATIIYNENLKVRNEANQQFNTTVPTVTLPDTTEN